MKSALQIEQRSFSSLTGEWCSPPSVDEVTGSLSPETDTAACARAAAAVASSFAFIRAKWSLTAATSPKTHACMKEEHLNGPLSHRSGLHMYITASAPLDQRSISS